MLHRAGGRYGQAQEPCLELVHSRRRSAGIQSLIGDAVHLGPRAPLSPAALDFSVGTAFTIVGGTAAQAAPERERRNVSESIIATSGVAGEFAAIVLGVHFLFADSAIAALIGFGVPFVLALGMKMSARG
jgi:hypothetical protein